MRISDWSSDVCSSDLWLCPTQGLWHAGASRCPAPAWAKCDSSHEFCAMQATRSVRRGAGYRRVARERGAGVSVGFVHLRLHTEYSLTDGVVRVEPPKRKGGGVGETLTSRARSEARRGGNECVSQCRSRGSPS